MNTFKKQEHYIVAACDKELLNKTLVEGKIMFFINPEFYGNKEASEKELVKEMKKATMINLVGEETCKVAVNNGIISKQGIKKICGVPHVQVFTI